MYLFQAPSDVSNLLSPSVPLLFFYLHEIEKKLKSSITALPQKEKKSMEKTFSASQMILFTPFVPAVLFSPLKNQAKKLILKSYLSCLARDVDGTGLTYTWVDSCI